MSAWTGYALAGFIVTCIGLYAKFFMEDDDDE